MSFKLRVRYVKKGRLRFLSHLEVTRALERIVRRASLPFAITQGFSPRMKIAFGPALPVGAAGFDEYFDVSLREYRDPEDILQDLKGNAPDDLMPLDARFVSERTTPLNASLVLAVWDVTIFHDSDICELRNIFTNRLGSGEIVVEHKGKKRKFDLGCVLWRPTGVEAAETVGDKKRAQITAYIRTGERGTLRAEAFVGQCERYLEQPIAIETIVRRSEYREGKSSEPLSPFSPEVE